jgi:hypothetical protein
LSSATNGIVVVNATSTPIVVTNVVTNVTWKKLGPFVKQGQPATCLTHYPIKWVLLKSDVYLKKMKERR